MITLRRSERAMCSLIRRATVSVPPPAAYGTTSVTGLEAGCAPTFDVSATSDRPTLVSVRLRSIMVPSLFFLVREAKLRCTIGQRRHIASLAARPLHQYIRLAFLVAAAIGALDLAKAVCAIEVNRSGVPLKHPELH